MLAWRKTAREGGNSAVWSRKATPASRAAAITLSALSRRPRRSRPIFAPSRMDFFSSSSRARSLAASGKASVRGSAQPPARRKAA